jgi:NADH:ubiquinone oxidoreductase subunit E
MRHLKIDPSDDTSPDRLFTVKQVRCIGACSLSPVIKIDDEVHGKLDPRKLQRILARYRKEMVEDDR